MKQQVNLYSFTARQSIWRQYSPFPQVAIGLALILMMLTVFSWLDKNELDKQLHTLSKQHDQLAQQLEKLSGLNNDAEVVQLQQSVRGLEAELTVRQATMSSIKAEGAANSVGFSLHLQGFARQHFEGLWLTAIDLAEGGQRIGLEGFAGEPAMVPRYIGNLSNEKIFAGTEFDVFNLQRAEDNAALAFAVTAVSEVEQ